MSSNQVAYAQKRRSSRIEKAIPLAVQGVDASRAPFQEDVTTVSISCHGCSYQMKHEVLPGAMVVLDMGQRANGYSEFPSRARVKWIHKLNAATDPAYGVAVEFESAGNIWGISIEEKGDISIEVHHEAICGACAIWSGTQGQAKGQVTSGWKAS